MADRLGARVSSNNIAKSAENNHGFELVLLKEKYFFFPFTLNGF